MGRVSVKKSRRSVLVLSSLLGSLGLTSVILLALSPQPLTPDAFSLFAIDGPETFQEIFQTRAPVANNRWSYIYIHHSRGPGGDLMSLSRTADGDDHFVIGNGRGCMDGEVQIGQRWIRQQPAAPAGARIDPACISICLVGDFDQAAPSALQQQRLAQLVGALQQRLRIAGQNVLVVDQPKSAAGIGRQFPVADFRQRILP